MAIPEICKHCGKEILTLEEMGATSPPKLKIKTINDMPYRDPE